MAKELKESLCKGPNQFDATGRTGWVLKLSKLSYSYRKTAIIFSVLYMKYSLLIHWLIESTPRYMAPEVFFSEPYGLPSDVFSYVLGEWKRSLNKHVK